MGKYQFSDSERYAVYTVHGEKCYVSVRPTAFSLRQNFCVEVSSMSEEKVVAQKVRRTAAEIEQIVSEYKSSGLNRSQFCQSRGLRFGVLNREPREHQTLLIAFAFAIIICVSLRSELDCEVSCEAVKGQDERRHSAAPLTASQLTSRDLRSTTHN
jgi:hypothetical protein